MKGKAREDTNRHGEQARCSEESGGFDFAPRPETRQLKLNRFDRAGENRRQDRRQNGAVEATQNCDVIAVPHSRDVAKPAIHGRRAKDAGGVVLVSTRGHGESLASAEGNRGT
jgi:hypothetical protein